MALDAQLNSYSSLLIVTLFCLMENGNVLERLLVFRPGIFEKSIISQ